MIRKDLYLLKFLWSVSWMQTFIISFVKLISTEVISEYVCDQTNLYAIQVISDALHSFSKHEFVKTWILVSARIEDFWGLMFVTELTEKPSLTQTLLDWRSCFWNSNNFENVSHSESILSFHHFFEWSMCYNSTDNVQNKTCTLKDATNRQRIQP